MERIEIHTETIRLDQALKLSCLVMSGAEAKLEIQAGEVTVNGETCLQRGKKLRAGDQFSFAGQDFVIEGPAEV